MNGLSTGRYTILRGVSSTNDYGDEVESQEVHLTGVRGSVIERTRKVFNPADSRVVTIRELTGRFAHGTDIRDGDRIKDEKTDIIFLVNSVNMPTAVANKPDIVLDLSLN